MVTIANLLGHALVETTERYTHLSDRSVADAADRVSTPHIGSPSLDRVRSACPPPARSCDAMPSRGIPDGGNGPAVTGRRQLS